MRDPDQTERTKAGGTNFESGFLSIAVINEALLVNTHQTRDNRVSVSSRSGPTVLG